MGATLIAGCGYVGSALARQLLTEGDQQVVGIRRRSGQLPIGVREHVADLAAPLDFSGLGPIATIVFAASAGTHDEAAYRRTYVIGLQNVLQAAARLRELPRRVVFISSTSVYGDAGGSLVTEDSPPIPDSFSGRIMLEAEGLLTASRLETVALRFGGIYGPDRWRTVESVLAGQATLLPNGGPITNRLHRDDGVRAVLHVLTLGSAAPVYNVVDDEPAPHNEVVSWLAARTGRQLGTSSTASTVSRQLRGNKRCSNAKLRASGFTFLYPTFREGYEQYFSDGQD